MDFGLGLILSFTNNASSGINSAINSLNQLSRIAENASNSINKMASLSALSIISNQLGSAFNNLGGSIISTFSRSISTINKTGQTLKYAESQLNQLYRSSDKTGKDVLNNISAYAKSSIFDFENLIPVVTMLKANGIEAFDEITSSTGKSRQMLMDYAADLAAFNPQMKNAYGTGIQAAMGALNEYIAEGNARSLKAGASLDITALLGEEKGSTIQERSRQVADLLEKLDMVGMTAQLAESPMTKLSNMGDTLFQFLGMVSESGVYDKFNDIVTKFADFVSEIPDEQLMNIAKSVGDALTSIMIPIEWISDKLIIFARSLANIVENNPSLLKFITIGSALVGVLLLITGIVLKVTSALSGLSLMLMMFGKSFKDIGTILKIGSLKMFSVLLPLTAMISLMYISWKNDFGGIKTILTSFVSNLKNSFQTANKAVNGSVLDLMNTLKVLNQKHDFFSNLTLGIIRLWTVFKAISEAWSDYTLSEDTFLKCKQLGILPLIEAILDLKWRLEHFVQGFKEGFNSILTSVVNFVTGFTSSLNGTIFDVLIEKATKFFQLLTNNDPQAWKDLGEFVGELAAKIIVAWGALKLFKGVGGRVISLGGLLLKLGGIFGSVFGGISGFIRLIIRGFLEVITLIRGGMISPLTLLGRVFTKILEILHNLKNVLGNVISFLLTLPSRINSLFSTIGGYIARFFHSIVTFIRNLPGMILNLINTIKSLIMNLPSIIANILRSIPNIIMNIIRGIISSFQSLPTLIMNIFKGVLGVIKGVIKFFTSAFGVITALVASVIVYATTHWEEFKSKILKIWDTIKEEASNIWNSIKDGLSSIWENLKSAVQPLVDKFNNLREKFNNLVTTMKENETFQKIIVVMSEIGKIVTDTVVPAIQGLLHSFSVAFQGIWNVVVNTFNAIVNIISSILGSVIDIISGILDIIVGIFTGDLEKIWDGVCSIFGAIYDTIASIVSNIWEVISSVFSSIADFIASIWEGIWNTISGFINSIFETISNFVSGINETVDLIGQYIKDGINAAITFITELPAKAIQWGKDFIDGLANGIKSSINKIVDAVKGVANKIRSFLHFSVPDEGALTDYETWMPDMMQGLADSLTGSQDIVIDALTQFTSNIKQTLSEDVLNTFQSFSENWINLMKQMVVSLVSLKTSISETLNEITLMTSKDFNGIFVNLNSTFRSSLSGIYNVIQITFSNIVTLTNGTWSNVKDTIESSLKETIVLVTDLLGQLNLLFNSEWSLPQIDISFYIDTLSQLLSGLNTNTLENQKEVLSTLNQLLIGLQDSYNNILSLVQGFVVSWCEYMKQIVDSTHVLDNKVSNSFKNISSLIPNTDGFRDSFEDMSLTIENYINILVEKFVILVNTFHDSVSSIQQGLITMKSNMETNFKDISNITNNIWNSVFNTINTSMTNSVNCVINSMTKIKQSFQDLKLPHINVTGDLALNPPSTPNFSVDWYKDGGVFNTPNIIGVGEAGKEVVMPLADNAKWISELGLNIASRINDFDSLSSDTGINNYTPSSNSDVISSSGSVTNNTTNNDSYLTTNNTTNNQEVHENNGSSVVFNEGSIVINCNHASEEEAIRMAKMIMEYIKRQIEIENMLLYK